MPSTELYTDVGKVAQALAFQTPEVLSQLVSPGATSIVLNQAPPSDWLIGSQLLIDINNCNLNEIVTITGISSNTVSVSRLSYLHAANVPVINITPLIPYVSMASRWFDTATYTPSGFAYEMVTDNKEAYVSNDGYIIIPLSKPIVDIADITSATFQTNPITPAITLDITKAWVTDNYMLKIAPGVWYRDRQGFASVTYLGGYNPLPDDICLAVTILAARLYKERDSGYSDVVGNGDMGTLQYKNSIPTDVRVVVEKYRRWTV